MLLILFVHYLSRNGDFFLKGNINTWLTVIRGFCFVLMIQQHWTLPDHHFHQKRWLMRVCIHFSVNIHSQGSLRLFFPAGVWAPEGREHEAVLTSECLTRMCQIPHQLSELFLIFQVYPPEFQDLICSFSSPGREFHSLNKWEERSVKKDA